MRKNLLILTCLVFFISQTAHAQSFKVAHDTIYINVASDTPYYNNVTNLSTSAITINWNIIATNFPSDWIPKLAFCDNKICYLNTSGTLWPAPTAHTSLPVAAGTVMLFDNATDLRSTTSRGCYYVTVKISNDSIPTDTAYETFMIKCPTGVNTISSEINNIKLYPNPATDNLNISYNANAGIEKIAVYNIVGSEMAVYKTPDPIHCNINLANLAPGMYFVRLLNATGNVVTVEKFMKE